MGLPTGCCRVEGEPLGPTLGSWDSLTATLGSELRDKWVWPQAASTLKSPDFLITHPSQICLIQITGRLKREDCECAPGLI